MTPLRILGIAATCIAAPIVFLALFPLLAAKEWLALGIGLAAVIASASIDSLAQLRRTAAAFVGFAALVLFLDFRNDAPNSLKHAFASSQFVPSLWNHHGTTPAALQSLPPALASFLGGFGMALLGCLFLLILALFVGRIYCSVLCPLGILQDIVSRLAKWVRKLLGGKKPRMPYRPPHTVIRQSILIFAVLAVSAGWSGVALAWLDPYSNFGRIISGIFRPLVILANDLIIRLAQILFGYDITFISRTNLEPWAGIGALLPPLLVLSLVTVMSALRGRLYCNTICPVGTLLGWFSKKALFRISIDKTSCIRCGHCVQECKAQCIDLNTQEVDASRCVGCFNCIPSCDDNGIKLNWLGRAPANGKRPVRVLKPKASETAPNTTGALTRRGFVTGVGGIALASGVGLLGGRFAKDAQAVTAIAPPGARSRSRFTENCTACQLCVSACPVGLLEPSLFDYGTAAGFMKPHMNYKKNYCQTECVACMAVCPDGALTLLPKEEKLKTQIGVAKLTIEKCIVRRDDTACGACGEHCPVAALQFVKGKSKFDEPTIDETVCIGCGACEYACPAKPDRAIVIIGFDEHKRAQELKTKKQENPNAGSDFAF